jgi:lipid A 3-O-deacylase
MQVRGVGSRALPLRVLVASAAAGFALLCAVPAANSADLPAPEAPAPEPVPPAVYMPAAVEPPVVGGQFEARFGVFDHGLGSAEHGTYDVAGAFVSPRLPNFGLPGYWAYLLPRFEIGGSYNTGGRTSFAHVDTLLTLPIIGGLYFEPFLGGAIHNGSLTATPTLSGLGCPVLFHAGASVGYAFGEHWMVAGTFEHLSNGKSLFGVNCGTNQTATGSNQGLNNYGISAGYRF